VVFEPTGYRITFVGVSIPGDNRIRHHALGNGAHKLRRNRNSRLRHAQKMLVQGRDQSLRSHLRFGPISIFRSGLKFWQLLQNISTALASVEGTRVISPVVMQGDRFLLLLAGMLCLCSSLATGDYMRISNPAHPKTTKKVSALDSFPARSAFARTACGAILTRRANASPPRQQTAHRHPSNRNPIAIPRVHHQVRNKLSLALRYLFRMSLLPLTSGVSSTSTPFSPTIDTNQGHQPTKHSL